MMKHNEEPLLDAPSKKSPGKKDTKRWCKGKVGVEHVVELKTSGWRNPQTDEFVTCRWVPWGRRPHYSCYCRKVCKTCGRVMDNGYLRDKTECPYWEPQPSEEEFARRWPTWAARRR
jgi:hypothetical protein